MRLKPLPDDCALLDSLLRVADQYLQDMTRAHHKSARSAAFMKAVPSTRTEGWLGLNLAKETETEWCQNALDGFPLDDQLWRHVDWPFQWDASKAQTSGSEALPSEFINAFETWYTELVRAVDLHEIAATEPFVSLVKQLKSDIFLKLSSPHSDDPGTPGKRKAIPAKYRTRPITLKKAAQYQGFVGKKAAERFKRHLEDEHKLFEKMSRQAYVFDIREFPERYHKFLKP